VSSKASTSSRSTHTRIVPSGDCTKPVHFGLSRLATGQHAEVDDDAAGFVGERYGELIGIDRHRSTFPYGGPA
jgi:hypothetical protein